LYILWLSQHYSSLLPNTPCSRRKSESAGQVMQTVIHIKADREVKENAVKIAKELGLSLSDIINASLRNFIRTREIVFSDTPRMTPELEKLLGKVEEDIKHNRNIDGPFYNVEEWNKYLDSK